MSFSSDFKLDKKRFLIQLLIAVVISVLFQLIINPFIYEPFIRSQRSVFINPGEIAVTSISIWFFSFSIAFFYYQDNELINSYLLCSLIPVIGTFVIEFIFYDFLHIPPIIIVIYILWKRRGTINLRYVISVSIVLSFWLLIVRLLEFNYTAIPFPLIVIVMLIWPFLNFLFGFIIVKL